MRRIQERRAAEAALGLKHDFLGTAAGSGGKKAFAALRREMKRLMDQAGARRERLTAEKLIEGLGLKRAD